MCKCASNRSAFRGTNCNCELTHCLARFRTVLARVDICYHFCRIHCAALHLVADRAVRSISEQQILFHFCENSLRILSDVNDAVFLERSAVPAFATAVVHLMPRFFETCTDSEIAQLVDGIQGVLLLRSMVC